MTDTYSAEQGFAAQRALRDALDMGPARFDDADLVRMLGDEIDAHREAGRDWTSIAEAISRATDANLPADRLEALHGGGRA